MWAETRNEYGILSTYVADSETLTGGWVEWLFCVLLSYFQCCRWVESLDPHQFYVCWKLELIIRIHILSSPENEEGHKGTNNAFEVPHLCMVTLSGMHGLVSWCDVFSVVERNRFKCNKTQLLMSFLLEIIFFLMCDMFCFLHIRSATGAPSACATCPAPSWPTPSGGPVCPSASVTPRGRCVVEFDLVCYNWLKSWSCLYWVL
jgi:hypothetical protein